MAIGELKRQRSSRFKGLVCFVTDFFILSHSLRRQCNWCKTANGADSAGGNADPDADYEGDADPIIPPSISRLESHVVDSLTNGVFTAPTISATSSSVSAPITTLTRGPPPGWPTAAPPPTVALPTTATSATEKSTEIYNALSATTATGAVSRPSIFASSSTKKGGMASITTGADGQNAGKGTDTQAACTPTRTTPAPSATWTSCEYKQRDGKLNPDVRWLNNTRDVVSMAQSVLWNGVAYGLSGDAAFAKRATDLIYTWYLDPRTAANPRLTYSQIVRGPKKEAGGYTGILDWRMNMKVVNAIVIMRNKGAEAWNQVIAAAMNSWAQEYVDWLNKSPAGKEGAKVANNHATFYYNQLISMNILLGDIPAAQAAANAYFTGPFMKQITANGEQPFEALRTRPFHYRCFNLEGAIANAKLADNLGLNFWSAKTSAGSTLQTAADYLIDLNPEEEDGTELGVLVAAIQAAYGDPNGKYQAFLDDDANTGDQEGVQSWRFYNNKEAFNASPAKGFTKSSQKFPAK